MHIVATIAAWCPPLGGDQVRLPESRWIEARPAMATQDPIGDLRTRLYWLMGLRVVVVTLLLGLSIAFQITKGEQVHTFYALIAATYALTIVYAMVGPWLTDFVGLTRFAYVQIGVDLILESILVAMTGAVESPFAVLYVITVSLASLVPRRQIGLATGAAAVLLLGFVTNLQVSGFFDLGGWIPASTLSPAETFQIFGVHGLAFVVVGFLSGALTGQLRRADLSLLEKEEGFNRLQAFHENIVQSISSGVFTTDNTGQITSFNRAAQEATGHTLDQVSGKPWRDVFSLPEAERAYETQTQEPWRLEVEGARADGSRLVLGLTLSPLHEEGVQTGLVGVFKDLTQIRDMEEEIRRREWFATLGEMSAGMAHEIRNPLGALAGAMQMLREDLPLEDTNRRLMNIAVRETTRLDAIITGFLQYARPPALNLKECDLNEVLKETLDLVRHEAWLHEGIKLETALAPGSLTAQIDPDQVKQVFWNLATNAFQAMPEGGELRISTGHRRVGSGEKQGDVIEIVFQDTGEGIRKEHMDKIFLPFFTTKKTGSGLGLAAIDRIVDLHSGWIKVESEEGKGAVFTVCFPQSAETARRLWHEGREQWKRF